MIETLHNKKWSAFTIENLFRIKKVSGLPIENYKYGKAPYISTSSTNNGLANFVFAQGKDISKGNCISVDPIKGVSFYQPFDFVGRGFSGASINLLYGDKINRYTALFICTAIEKTSEKKASYGYLFNGDRLAKAKVFLPVTNEGEPDYKFMEKYVKDRENNLKKQYAVYVDILVARLYKNIKKDKEWRAFSVSEIFDTIQRGKRLVKERQKTGKIPYVSSTALNNGVDNFIGNDVGIRKFNNCLSLANSGSVGSCFYEPFTFIASDHITHLKGNYSKYQYLFMACMLNRLAEKYNFNREINDLRIQKEKIFLPINLKGEPDYKYMEDYMKYLEQQKIISYLDYIG